MEYLLAWRMAVAKDLLRRHDFGIAEVAERVGYGSASTFSTAFQPTRGPAPKSLRPRALEGRVERDFASRRPDMRMLVYRTSRAPAGRVAARTSSGPEERERRNS